MTATQLAHLAEELRELSNWIEANRPGSLDQLLIAGVRDVVLDEISRLLSEVKARG